jgi:hypothetical protein
LSFKRLREIDVVIKRKTAAGKTLEVLLCSVHWLGNVLVGGGEPEHVDVVSP